MLVRVLLSKSKTTLIVMALENKNCYICEVDILKWNFHPLFALHKGFLKIIMARNSYTEMFSAEYVDRTNKMQEKDILNWTRSILTYFKDPYIHVLFIRSPNTHLLTLRLLTKTLINWSEQVDLGACAEPHWLQFSRCKHRGLPQEI